MSWGILDCRRGLPKPWIKSLGTSFGALLRIEKDASDRLGYCYTSQGYGGLGIQKSAIRNKAILSSLAWRVCQGGTNLWKLILHNKYKNHPATRNTRQGVFRTWKNIQDGWKSISSATRWVVQKRDRVNFLHDNWVPHFVPLRHCIHGPLLEDEYNLFVADLRMGMLFGQAVSNFHERYSMSHPRCCHLWQFLHSRQDDLGDYAKWSIHHIFGLFSHC